MGTKIDLRPPCSRACCERAPHGSRPGQPAVMAAESRKIVARLLPAFISVCAIKHVLAAQPTILHARVSCPEVTQSYVRLPSPITRNNHHFPRLRHHRRQPGTGWHTEQPGLVSFVPRLAASPRRTVGKSSAHAAQMQVPTGAPAWLHLHSYR